jgi:uncharacterized membrane protein
MSEQLTERLDRFERTLAQLHDELAALRRLAASAQPVPVPEPMQTRVELPPQPAAAPAAPARVRVPTPPVQAAPRFGEGFGARALALSGGAVTLLGVVLFFALAVNRGWIGPWQRCGIGAAASAIVFLGGLWLRRRYGQTHSALAAVGAGIGGGFATLLAAAALYDLLPDIAALVVAAAIAAVAVVTAIAWSAQLVAGLGLVGAMLVPLGVVFDRGLTVLGTSFVAVMLVATGIVSLRHRWWRLLVAAVLASGAQIAGLVWQSSPGSTAVTVLAAVFWLTYLGLAIARQLRGKRLLGSLAASLALFAAGFAGGSAGRLFDGLDEGFALLVIAVTYGSAGFLPLARRGRRDLGSLLWAIGLAVGAVAVSDFFSGNVLAVAWAAEATVLAWLTVRAREPRFQLGALAYLALATGHALTLDAPPARLFVSSENPAAGAVAVAAAALAAGICAAFARRPRKADRPAAGVFRCLEPLFAWLRANQLVLREAFRWTAGVLASYAVSLGLLEFFQLGVGFDWGAPPVTVLWTLESASLLVVGARTGSRRLCHGGGIVLGLSLAKVFLYDLGWLPEPVGYYSALATGSVVLLGGYLHGKERRGRGTGAATVASVLASAVLLTTAVTGLLGGIAEGAVLLSLGASYALFAATVFSCRRDLSTWLWATGLVIVVTAWDDLFGGTLLVTAWAATGVALAWLASRAGEHRLRLAAVLPVGLGLLGTLTVVAPPRDLFVAGPHPGEGVLGLAAIALASAGLGFFARSAPQREVPIRRLARWSYAVDSRAVRSAPWIAGVLAIESVSLAILQVFQWGGSGSVHLEFQHGHTAVSTFWGVLGLAALYVGLRRRSGRLRRAGFAIFALSLAKIFLYDLSQLSSITRALSFLAVGAVLLLGGFFYQRLSSELEERQATI